jgi:glutaredoxin 3
LFARLSEENGGWRTVPMVFIEDKFVGGFDDTKALAQKGDLDHLRS